MTTPLARYAYESLASVDRVAPTPAFVADLIGVLAGWPSFESDRWRGLSDYQRRSLRNGATVLYWRYCAPAALPLEAIGHRLGGHRKPTIYAIRAWTLRRLARPDRRHLLEAAPWWRAPHSTRLQVALGLVAAPPDVERSSIGSYDRA